MASYTMDDIRIALACFPAVPGDLKENLQKTGKLMRMASREGAGFVVFPECSLTGYAPEKAAGFGVEPSDPASDSGSFVRAAEDLCGELSVSACFGYMEKLGGRLYIAQEIFSSGQRTVYRKTHLGSGEEPYFSAGSSFPAADVRAERGSVRTGMQLCWESHIPDISGAYRRQGVQLLLFPYSSGMSGEKCLENWSIHLPARASDCGCFAAACNQPPVKAGSAIRPSTLAVWDPKGRLIAKKTDAEEGLLICTLGGELPRERFEKIRAGRAEEDMHFISYFDRRREDLFQPSEGRSPGGSIHDGGY